MSQHYSQPESNKTFKPVVVGVGGAILVALIILAFLTV